MRLLAVPQVLLRKRRHLRGGLLALSLLVLTATSGCAHLGPPYQRITRIPPGTALVYVYRPSGFVGAAVTYTVHAGPRPLGKLPPGGYLYATLPAGPVELWAETEAKSSVVLNLVAGKVYFVRGTVGFGVLVGRPHLEVVPNPVAEPEAAQCNLVLPDT